MSGQGLIWVLVYLKGWCFKENIWKVWWSTYTWRARPSGPLSCSQECSCWKRDKKVSACYHSRLVQGVYNCLEMSSWQTFVWVMAGLENDPSVKLKAVITWQTFKQWYIRRKLRRGNSNIVKPSICSQEFASKLATRRIINANRL